MFSLGAGLNMSIMRALFFVAATMAATNIISKSSGETTSNINLFGTRCVRVGVQLIAVLLLPCSVGRPDVIFLLFHDVLQINETCMYCM